MKIEINIPDEAIVVCVRIAGEPQAWLRAGRGLHGHTFNPKANTDAKKRLREAIQARHPNFPDAMDRINRFGIATIFETKMFNTDFDNYLKQTCDSIQGFVFHNDRQVDESYALVVRDAEKPNLQLIVWRKTSSLGGKQI